ncbi:homeobox protein prospero isoform X5 [Chironomus tepperi]|uniref:homeobox protein prospero isoform X5 n=1 Tax=Chironomus tepperi TaxID=113505 RepID=UPI00391F85F9
MMSSAEEDNSDCFSSLFGDDDKLGLLKQHKEQLKRNRQRVDAGEPRNSYSSIPNFSSRSSLMSGSLYGAIFSQQSQNFGGLFPTNYAPAKMLNELLGRQVKQAQDAVTNSNDVLNQIESASNNNNSVKMDFDSVQSHNSDGGQSPTQQSANDLAHHMLRNILQGKKDLMALDQELRQVAAGVGNDRHTPDSNQNTIMNSKTSNILNNNNNLMNNNNNNNYDVTKSDNVNGSIDSDQNSDVTINNSSNNVNNNNNVNNKLSTSEKDLKKINLNSGSDNDINGTSHDGKKDDTNEIIDDDMIVNSLADGSSSLPSPSSVNNVKLKEELMDGDLDKELCRSPSPSPSASNKSDHGNALELKRARVENIVSTMHSSPVLGSQGSIQQPQVNGCKKRKLYHPQQHDNSAVERYGLSLGLNLHNLMLNDDDEDEEMDTSIVQKRHEKNILKSQLRSMQEQLAEMQQKYVQLCNRMEQTSESTEDIDDGTSDLVDDDLMRENSSEKRSPSMNSVQQQRTPSTSPNKDLPGKQQVSHAQNVLNQMMSKMMSAKLHHPSMPFNGTHPLLQHMQQQNAGSEHVGHVQHPAFSNAAAMYLSQKLLMEQEARIAKEVEERQQLQLQQQQQQQQLQKQQQEQQQKAQQEMIAREQQAQNMHSMHQQQIVNHTPNNIPPLKTSPQQQQQSNGAGKPNVPSDLSDRLSMMRVNALAATVNSIGPVTGADLEGLADILKSEINSSLSALVDTIVSRFVHQRRIMTKQSEAAAAAAEQLNKDLMMASQILDRKSPRTKSSGTDRPNGSNNGNGSGGNANTQSAGMFQGPPKVSGPQMNSVAAAALYNSISAMNGGQPNGNPFCMPEPPREGINEQNEALSLVVTPKKKRHKVTDTRITPRTVSRILAQDALAAAQQNHLEQRQDQQNQNSNSSQQQQQMNGSNGQNSQSMQNGNKSFGSTTPINIPSSIPSETPSPRGNYHHSAPPSMMPVSLPTSVAIPNPSLHESQVFSPYSPFFNPHGPHGPQSTSIHHHMHMSSSPPGMGSLMDPRDSPPLPHPPTMLHPALLAAAHHGASPDYGHIRAAIDANDRNSDCNSADISYDGMQPSISFSNAFLKTLNSNKQKQEQNQDQFSLTTIHSATLTPMHLRKAKLMFFWVRYPSSAVLKMYFPDIKFNKNNTAQLVKWFSNFREFYYIQMEKYARQNVTEGVKSVDDIHISGDSEIYRVLNLHYNRNNHIEVPPNFRFVIEQTLREFFRAIQGGKDNEQSWKKSIYKVISRMDDPVPEYFKSPNFLEQLE